MKIVEHIVKKVQEKVQEWFHRKDFNLTIVIFFFFLQIINI